MNKLFFRLLIVLMSLSLIGIILVQVYWFNSSFQNNDEQFRFHVQQAIGNVSNKLQKQEEFKKRFTWTVGIIVIGAALVQYIANLYSKIK